MRGAVAAAVLAAAMSPHAASAAAALPQIVAIPVEDGVRLEASVLGLGAGEVTALFRIEREERGNRLNSSQSTTFPVTAGERHVVANTTFPLDAGTRLNARLELRNGEDVLADAQLTLGTEEK